MNQHREAGKETICYQVDPGYRHMGYPNKGELSMPEIRALQEKARERKHEG